MATKSNRAATSANKKGGNPKRRNQATKLIDRHKRLKAPVNRRAFLAGRRETVARERNAMTTQEPLTASFALESSAFVYRANAPGEIRDPYTSFGDNLSPPLDWGGIPPEAEELVLLMEDLSKLDDHSNPLVHWLVYRIPATVTEFPRGIPRGDLIADIDGVPLQGRNSVGVVGYTGPNPPRFDEWHHYRFSLYALDAALEGLSPGLEWEEIHEMMHGHIVDVAELMGRCRR